MEIKGFNRSLVIAGGILGASALFVACGGDDDDEPNSQASPTPTSAPVAEVTAEQVMENYRAMAYAAYSDSLATAETLKTAVDLFLTEPTDSNLDAAKEAYKEARIPYQQSEIMRWDTPITLDAGLDNDGGPASVDEWEGQVNAWPLDENHIVGIIEGTEEINTELLLAQNGADDNEANVTTGIHAVEFMLWGADTNGTDAGAGERPVSDFLCMTEICSRRGTYLSVATDLLVEDLTAMQAEWSPEAVTTLGTLAYNFMNSDLAIDYIVGSMKVMATDELASARMSAGLTLRDPEEEHDCFSDLSHVAIYYNFQAVRNAFYGRYGDIDGPSVGDLVRARDEATFEAIDAAFDSIESKMAEILALGEDTMSPVKFDQIIGLEDGAAERVVAVEASNELVGLLTNFNTIEELLSLSDINAGGGGDGD